jgi:hypothetical protein
MLGTTQFVFNERAVRPGSGEAIPAEYLVDAPEEQLTEAAQVSGQPEALKRATPKALIAASGPHAGQRFELKPGDNAIGRSEGGIILGADAQVSRKHCAITLSATGATLIDNGSSNGTRLNGAPLQPGMAQPVFAGDELGIGAGAYRLE